MKKIVGFVFILLFFAASFPASDLSVFYDHRNSFSYGVRNQDRDETDKGLENLKNDYNVFSGWRLQYFADRWFFNKMYQYEAAANILNEDFERAEELLKNHEDDYYASYMLGIAKFKTLHFAYQQAMLEKDKKQMSAILNFVLEKVRPDFERCVRQGPGPADNFNCSFNYDLTSDPASAQKSLQSQKPKPRYVLGSPDGRLPVSGDEEPGEKESPGLNPDEKKKAGKGGARRVG